MPQPEPGVLGLHAAWWLLSATLGLVLAIRPNPRAALAALILMHNLAFLGYYGNLARPYAVGISADRGLVLGMARAVADGGSPFGHVQVQFGNLEPFWTLLVAALSGFSSDRVAAVYGASPLVALTLTALGFYWGWGRPRGGEDRDHAAWRGVFMAASVLGLSSLSLLARPAVLPFWCANFVFKPNHAIAFGLIGLLSGPRSSGPAWVREGILLGLLMWVFILDWGYLVPGLVCAAALETDWKGALKRLVAALGVSLAVGAPYIYHLLGDYNPVGGEKLPQIWYNSLQERLTSSFWWTLDLGPLFFLFLMALVRASRNRSRDRALLGFLLTAPFVTVAYMIGLRAGLAPEPDEAFYWVRMVIAAGAGYAVWALVPWSRVPRPRWAGFAFGAVLAVSLPGSFDPVRQDRYFLRSLTPLDKPLLETAAWLRQNTTVADVLVSSRSFDLAPLTGRRFLMVRPDQTADRVEREWAEKQILTSLDETRVREAVNRYGVTHVVLDGGLADKYGADELRRLGNRPWFTPAHVNSYARIFILKRP